MRRYAILLASWVLVTASAKADPVKDQAVYPSTYVFQCEYDYSDLRGSISSREMARGTYTELSPHSATWSNVSISSASGLADFGPPVDQGYMDSMTYDPQDFDKQSTPQFFAAFPANAADAKNLVWDTEMFHTYLTHLADLSPGKDIDLPSSASSLAGQGSFLNSPTRLTNIGTGPWSGRSCTIIQYAAFFNPMNMQNPSMSLVGRSHFWGEIWVDASTKAIEHATIYEDFMGILTTEQGAQPQFISILRKGAFTKQQAPTSTRE